MEAYATAFFVYVLLDIVWAKYIVAISEDQIRPAMFWSSIMIVLAGIGIVAIVHDPVSIVFAAAGGALGTYLGMKLK